VEFRERDQKWCEALLKRSANIRICLFFDGGSSVYGIDEGQKIETDFCESHYFLPEWTNSEEFFGGRTWKVEIDDGYLLEQMPKSFKLSDGVCSQHCHDDDSIDILLGRALLCDYLCEPRAEHFALLPQCAHYMPRSSLDVEVGSVFFIVGLSESVVDDFLMVLAHHRTPGLHTDTLL